MPEPITAQPKTPDGENPAAAWSLEKPKPEQKIAEPKQDPLIRRATDMLKRMAGVKQQDGSETKNPDEVLEEIAKPPALQEKIDEANDQLTAARKAYVEKGYGIKGMFTNTETAKSEYTQALQKMRELKLQKVREEVDAHPEWQQKQEGEQESQAERIIRQELLSLPKYEFVALQQTENDLWEGRSSTKFTETAKMLLDKYKALTSGVNKFVGKKLFGVDQDSSKAKQIGAAYASGFLVNISANIVTGGALAIPMRILGGAVAAEGFRTATESMATSVREKRMEGKTQEVLQQASSENGQIDLDKIDFFLENQAHDIADKFANYKTMRGFRTVGAYAAAVGISLASRTASEYTRGKLREFANSETGSHMISKASETWSSIKTNLRDTAKGLMSTPESFANPTQGVATAMSAEQLHALQQPPQLDALDDIHVPSLDEAANQGADTDKIRQMIIEGRRITLDQFDNLVGNVKSEVAIQVEKQIQTLQEVAQQQANAFKDLAEDILNNLKSLHSHEVLPGQGIPPELPEVTTLPRPAMPDVIPPSSSAGVPDIKVVPPTQTPIVPNVDLPRASIPPPEHPQVTTAVDVLTPPKIIMPIEVGEVDNLWKIIDRQIGTQASGLNEGRHTYAIDELKDKFAAMTQDQLQKIGFIKNPITGKFDINYLRTGQKLDLTSVLGEYRQGITTAVGHAAEIPDASAASIEKNNQIISEFFGKHPGVQATSENIDAVLKGNGESLLHPKPSVAIEQPRGGPATVESILDSTNPSSAKVQDELLAEVRHAEVKFGAEGWPFNGESPAQYIDRITSMEKTRIGRLANETALPHNILLTEQPVDKILQAGNENVRGQVLGSIEAARAKLGNLGNPQNGETYGQYMDRVNKLTKDHLASLINQPTGKK